VNTNLETVGRVAVVELLGETLDATTADDVQGYLSYLAADHPHLVVDLHRIHFVDSAGCGALVHAHRRCQEAGGDLRLCRASEPVRTVLGLARLARVLHLHPTREEAVAAFGGRP
jgi:anti-sigma B factor antagonist